MHNQPDIFKYADYRTFLKDFYRHKKASSPRFTASSFARKAGLNMNSRGYLKLVMDGKRNLTLSTIRGFSEALGFQTQQSLYFESLVLFNQAADEKEKQYYFPRLQILTTTLSSLSAAP